MCLNRHKLEIGHNKRALATESEPKKKSHKTKQRTINEMLHNQREIKDETDDDEDACSADDCKISCGDGAVINWICCEVCDAWYHSVCLGEKSESEIEEMNYTCCTQTNNEYEYQNNDSIYKIKIMTSFTPFTLFAEFSCVYIFHIGPLCVYIFASPGEPTRQHFLQE